MVTIANTFMYKGILCAVTKMVHEGLGKDNCPATVAHFLSEEPPDTILWVPDELVTDPTNADEELPMYTMSNGTIDLLFWPMLLGGQRCLMVQHRLERADMDGELSFPSPV